MDLVEGFNSFRLMGADITLPMPVQDFMEAGFYLQDENLDEMIEANNSYGYAYYSRLTDEYLGTLFIYNTSSKDQKVQDGIIDPGFIARVRFAVSAHLFVKKL